MPYVVFFNINYHLHAEKYKLCLASGFVSSFHLAVGFIVVKISTVPQSRRTGVLSFPRCTASCSVPLWGWLPGAQGRRAGNGGGEPYAVQDGNHWWSPKAAARSETAAVPLMCLILLPTAFPSRGFPELQSHAGPLCQHRTQAKSGLQLTSPWNVESEQLNISFSG